MAKTVADVMKMVKENEVKFVDFRFTDTRGKEQHVTVPVSHFDEDKFSSGHAFDGSSVAGWKGIEASDMQLMPDPNTANLDPFFEETTLFLQCDVIEPGDGKAYDRDPRSIAKRAEAYLKASGLGDTAFFGPEPEFFIFDNVRWSNEPGRVFSEIEEYEAPDSVKKHDKFALKHSLSVILGSDEDNALANLYGVWKEKSMYGRTYMGVERTTFLIGADGRIAKIWPKVKVAGHAEEVLEAAKAL